MTDPGPAPTSSRRLTALPVAILAGALVLGATTGFVIHRVNEVAAFPPITSSSGTSSTPSRPATTSPSPKTSASSTPTDSPTTAQSDLPRGAPLDDDQFVVPRGPADGQLLYVARVAGPAGPKRLPTPKGDRVNSPTLSVDRRTIIYIDRTADRLRVIGADGTGDRELFSKHPAGCGTIGHVSWNRADQSQLVLRCTNDSNRVRLFVITIGGEQIRQLEIGNVRMDDPAISPDGKLVAFWMANTTKKANGGGLFTMPLDGSAEPTELTPDRVGRDADPAWSPDGTRIAFRRSTVNSRFDVYVADADGSGVKRLVGGSADDEKPAWSPDGSQLLVVSNRATSTTAKKTADLFLIKASGGTPKPVGVSAVNVTTPVWASR